ncbi:MAG: glucose 1-dehydrogenase [Leptospirales bacterium]|nr:glucose 1-dehydrogenase [Leptospirales bacterium]
MSVPLISFENKTILITGASRGIGRAIAEGFGRHGATVYGTARAESSLDWMAAAGMHGRAADVSQPGAVAAVIEEIVARHGRLDCLLNNAGVASNTPSGGMKEGEMDMIINTNFKGVFRACQAYYKAQRRSGGVIINMASVLGLVGAPLAGVYCGTKGAVIQTTRALAVEWASAGFRVNAIAPGFIDTDMTEMIKKRPAVREKLLGQIPMNRMGQPEDIVGAALYLASDLSSYVTGHVLVVDGGVTAM